VIFLDEFPKVWISKWVDYSNKYGLGFQLTDGTMGVHFNDHTVMMMASDEMYTFFCFLVFFFEISHLFI
jgi:hypothetical protein